MKRHMKLVFRILEHAETHASGSRDVPLPELAEYSCAVVAYHAELCREAGYLSRTTRIGGDDPQVLIGRLTWAGHNELDRIRREGCCN